MLGAGSSYSLKDNRLSKIVLKHYDDGSEDLSNPYL